MIGFLFATHLLLFAFRLLSLVLLDVLLPPDWPIGASAATVARKYSDITSVYICVVDINGSYKEGY